MSNNKCLSNMTNIFTQKLILAIVGVVVTIVFTGCGGGGGDGGGDNAASYNSQYQAPSTILGATFRGTVGEIISGTFGLQKDAKFYLRFKSLSEIIGTGENVVNTTSWRYDVLDKGATGRATLNYTWGKDVFELKFAKPCSGTYVLVETSYASGSQGKISGPFTIEGVGCSDLERLYSNPSTDQWNKAEKGTFGNILIKNMAYHAIDVALWHPDDGSFFGVYHINARQNVYLSSNNKNINVESNWGIQVPGQGIENVSKRGVYITSGSYPYWEYQFPTVTTASDPAKKITSFSFNSPVATGVIHEGAKAITLTVPFGTDLKNLVASFTTSGASVKVGETPQVSGITANDFSSPVIYTVMSADGSSINYTVTVRIPAYTDNGDGTVTANTGLDWQQQDDGVLREWLPSIDYCANLSLVGSGWRLPSISELQGLVDKNYSPAINPIFTNTKNNAYWTANAYDSTYAYYVSFGSGYTDYINQAGDYNARCVRDSAIRSQKAITGFTFANPAATGVINEDTKTISVVLPYGTNVADMTALVASFTTTGVSVEVGATAQESDITANDFTGPVVYTVTALDASTVNYTVTVTVALNYAKAITGYSFSTLDLTGVINEDAKTITVTMPYGTTSADITALTASFVTTGASVKVGGATQESGITENDFNSPVVYTVTALDSSTVEYTVIVTCGKAITKFSFTNPEATGTFTHYNDYYKELLVTVPYETDLSTLIASFTATAASVYVGATQQISGVTVNDFTNPVVYTATDLDSSSDDYTVKVIRSIYIDNGNGTVTSKITGLNWQKEANTAALLSWNNANSYCSSLSLAGSGWRLPTIDELKSLWMADGYYNVNPLLLYPATILPNSYRFWSSSPDLSKMYYLDFGNGAVLSDPPSNTLAYYRHYVRCVR